MFAECCEELYTSTTNTHEHEHEDKYEQHQDTMTPFRMQEINDAINQLKRGKEADTKGVNAEMIKYSTRRQKHVLRLYNRAIKHHEQPPPNRRDTAIKVIYKNGDLASP